MPSEPNGKGPPLLQGLERERGRVSFAQSTDVPLEQQVRVTDLLGEESKSSIFMETLGVDTLLPSSWSEFLH